MKAAVPSAELEIELPPGYNGPPRSANGGFACGTFAAALGGGRDARVAVTLLSPPPMGRRLELRPAARRTTVWDDTGGDLVAVLTEHDDALDVSPLLPAVTADDARAAESRFEGDDGHPFPTCFVCGPDRTAADGGLGLRPGPVPGAAMPTVACIWTAPAATSPDATPEAVVWAVLDCPGGWTDDPTRNPAVLGRMRAAIDRLPDPGATYVVVATQTERDDEGITTVSALVDPEGRHLAWATARWMPLSR